MDFVRYAESEAQSLEDFDNMIQNSKGDQLAGYLATKRLEYQNMMAQVPKDARGNPVSKRAFNVNSDAVRTLGALNDIAAEFENKFGKDAMKKIVTEAGGKYDENSRPVIELIKVIFGYNDKFNGQDRVFQAHYETALNVEKYEKNLSGVMNIFIDGLDSYVKRLHLQPVNSSGAV